MDRLLWLWLLPGKRFAEDTPVVSEQLSLPLWLQLQVLHTTQLRWGTSSLSTAVYRSASLLQERTSSAWMSSSKPSSSEESGWICITREKWEGRDKHVSCLTVFSFFLLCTYLPSVFWEGESPFLQCHLQFFLAYCLNFTLFPELLFLLMKAKTEALLCISLW